MKLSTLKVPRFNSTLMGLVKAVADYDGLEASDGWLYGASGHAFFMNIHNELCPSGPYVWNRRPFFDLLGNLGLRMVDHGFYSAKASSSERERIEATLKSALDAGRPCGLVNMEYQLINGYDETGFHTSQPWAPKVDFPPSHLSFSTWKELGNGIHVNFFTFEMTQPLPRTEAARKGLEYALDLHANPGRHSEAPYAAGLPAYDNFAKAVRDGHGGTHGNWWNATVWSECRARAADFLREIAQDFPSAADVAASLSADYGFLAEALAKISDKKLESETKLALIEEAKSRESQTVPALRELTGGEWDSDQTAI